MDESPKDFKQSGKNVTENLQFDQYTKYLNYSVFPNFKVYSLSTQPLDNPIASAAASAAANNTLPFSDPQPIVKAFQLESVNDYDIEKKAHQNHKQQHLNLQEQLEQHKNFHSEKRQSRKNNENESGSIFLQPEVKVVPRSNYKATVASDKASFQTSKVTETLFAPHTPQRESSKSIFFGRAFTDLWMSTTDSALVLTSGPIGNPDDVWNRVRSIILKVRRPVADYQIKNGVPIQEQISFVNLIRMLFVCSHTAVLTILTMLWNLYPLLDGFLYVLRFVLDKILYVCQGETSAERVYRSCIFVGEMIILLLANLFIINLIVMPIMYLMMYTMGNCTRLMGLYS